MREPAQEIVGTAEGAEVAEGAVADLPEVLQDADVRAALTKGIQRRMTPQPLKIRADIELTCFQYDGVLHLQEAMRVGASGSTDACPVKVTRDARSSTPPVCHALRRSVYASPYTARPTIVSCRVVWDSRVCGVRSGELSGMDGSVRNATRGSTTQAVGTGTANPWHLCEREPPKPISCLPSW